MAYLNHSVKIFLFSFCFKRETVNLLQAPIQKFADKLSAYFVPTVVIISIVTWVVWLIIGFVDISLLRKTYNVSVVYHSL